MNMETNEKKTYEIGFIAKDEKGIHELMDRLKAHGAEILLEGPVEHISLAYEIKKEKEANLGFLHFSAEAASIKPLSDELKRSESILRFLITTPPYIKPKPRQMPPDRAKSSQKQTPVATDRVAAPEHLSNEALEKKIEEILQES